jgi:hypothetical protein
MYFIIKAKCTFDFDVFAAGLFERNEEPTPSQAMSLSSYLLVTFLKHLRMMVAGWGTRATSMAGNRFETPLVCFNATQQP